MKRLFCFFTVVFAVFSFLALTFGEKFCVYSLIVFFSLFLILVLFRLIFKLRQLHVGITATVFAFVAVFLVLTVHLPRLETAKALDSRYVEAEGRIVSVTKNKSYVSLTVKCDEIDNVNSTQKVTVITRNNDSFTGDVGQSIAFSGTLEFDASSFNKGKEAFLTVFPTHCEVTESNSVFGNFVYSVRRRISEIADSMHHSPLIKALLIGDKSEVDDELINAFKLLGTSHLLAISGLHLSIIVMTFYMLITRLGVPHLFSSTLSTLMALFYMAITGFSLSLIRAGQMMIVFFFARTVRRRNDSITALFVAGFVILLMSPWSLFNVGFLLSFFSTFGILAFCPAITDKYRKYILDKEEKGVRFSRRQRFVQKVIREILIAFSTTLSATVVTLPIIICVFNEVSLFSLVGNIFTVSLAKYFLMFSFASVMLQCMGITYLSLPFTFISSVSGTVFLSFTRFLGSIAPGLVSINAVYLYVGVAILTAMVLLFLCFSRRAWSLPCLIIILSVFIPIFNIASDKLIYSTALVDTVTKNGANTAVVRWKDKSYILDQTASNSQRLYGINGIADKNGITSIDNAVFITTDTVPVERISVFLTLFDIDTVTVVTNRYDMEALYKISELCSTHGAEVVVNFSEKYEVADGITAYCYKDVCTAFLIENDETSFCTYRALSDLFCLYELMEADTVLLDGKTLVFDREFTDSTSFRLT
ncbi:MAG: ComEC/Rec2 family competence protein [Clostridia bacterium]|nr:ComEC/Rec2 family competence protein [Clostridia bacterium]